MDEINSDFKEVRESLLLFIKAISSESEEEWDEILKRVRK